MNSDYILNVLETVKFVFCLQIHALAECTMNSKFCRILYQKNFSIQNFLFIVHSACACICRQNTHNSLTLKYSVIKTCLALWHRSKQSYKILQESGFIKLPSARLLQYHKGKIKQITAVL